MTNLDLYPALESGVYVLADTIQADPSFRIRTAQGTAAFRASEVGFGNPAHVLDGRVTIERIPVMTVLTNSVEEQDLPATAKFGDTVYMTYLEFTHGARELKWRRQLRTEPESFDPLSRPAGGDRIWLREYSIADGQWGEPQAVGAGGQDIYSAAVAVDGQGRVWVVRSKQVDGDFDIYASFRDQGRWSAEMRVTSHPGPDIGPAAVTDADGAVWITWQGYRENLEVLVARQAGDGFSEEQTVSASSESDWAPQIAAARSEGVAISWDTYDSGNYDGYARHLYSRDQRCLRQPRQALGRLRGLISGLGQGLRRVRDHRGGTLPRHYRAGEGPAGQAPVRAGSACRGRLRRSARL